MKKYLISILGVALFLFIGCGQGGSEFGNPGTVIVKGGIGSGSADGSVSAVVVEGSTNEVLVRTYRISLGDSNDCSAATFVDIVDETSDTSDCIIEPEDTSTFLDISNSPTMASNNSVEAGTYSCVRITICDQMVWSTSDIPQCSGTQVLDVSEPSDEANVETYYWSTIGITVDDEDVGTAGLPFSLTEPVVVTGGTTTTLVFSMSNNDAGDEMIAEYNSDNDDEHQCEVAAPVMTITEE